MRAVDEEKSKRIHQQIHHWGSNHLFWNKKDLFVKNTDYNDNVTDICDSNIFKCF